MRWMALALAVGLGSLTLLTHDSRYIQLKPTIAHVAIGSVMLKRGWLLRYLPPLVKDWLPEATVVAWGYAWAAIMLAMGIANVAAAQWLSIGAWAAFLTTLFLGKVLLGTAQYLAMRRTIVRRMSAQATSAAP
jgi:intracellular septation protein